MKCRLLLDVVVTQSATILKLLAGKNKALLVGRNTTDALNQYEARLETQKHEPFLVLDLGLDIVDCVGRLYLEGDRLAREGLDENLHFCRKMSGESGSVDDELTWNTVVGGWRQRLWE